MNALTDPITLFERWFVIPLRQIEQIASGDGGIVAFSSSLYLYERYAKALLDAAEQKADDAAFHAQLLRDFDFISPNDAKLFWHVARDGFLHQGMALAAGRGGAQLPPWLMDGNFEKAIEFRILDGTRVLCIQPWLFMNRVFRLFHDRPDLIIQTRSFPWASIYAG